MGPRVSPTNATKAVFFLPLASLAADLCVEEKKSAQKPTLGGASRVWTSPAKSAVANLRRGVVGFTRSDDGGGIIWVGKGGGFCKLPSPPFSSGNYG